MYTGHRQDRHYYGLFGFLAAKEEDIREQSKKPESDVRIHQALKWLKGHNHLYSEFYSNFETLYRYQERPSIQKALGMIFPSSSQYFDQFPAIHSVQQAAGIQHPREGQSERMEQAINKLKDMTKLHYGEIYLEPKLFPHLHSCGFGGWYFGCPMEFADHTKMRLYDVRGCFA